MEQSVSFWSNGSLMHSTIFGLVRPLASQILPVRYSFLPHPLDAAFGIQARKMAGE